MSLTSRLANLFAANDQNPPTPSPHGEAVLADPPPKSSSSILPFLSHVTTESSAMEEEEEEARPPYFHVRNLTLTPFAPFVIQDGTIDFELLGHDSWWHWWHHRRPPPPLSRHRQDAAAGRSAHTPTIYIHVEYLCSDLPAGRHSARTLQRCDSRLSRLLSRNRDILRDIRVQ